MPKTVTCRDVGVDCDFKAQGKDETEVMRKVEEHARTVHHINPIPQDLQNKVRSAIHDEK